MERRSKDLLQLERKDSPASAIESALLVCNNKEDSSQQADDKKPTISSLPKSQVLGKVKDFLGVMAEANRRLEVEAKDNSGAYDIEALTGNESNVIEMDLMLGIADLNTPAAVAAAEAALSGNQSVVPVAAGDSDTESEDSSDDSKESDNDDENGDANESSSSLMEVTTSEKGKDDSSRDAVGKGRSKKRPKIVELS